MDHLIIINESHLRAILRSYIYYYNTQRTHLGINNDSPEPREVQAEGEIHKVAVVNRLHRFYFRKAAYEASNRLIANSSYVHQVKSLPSPGRV